MIGHVAQAGWHLQHALSYCPTTSNNVREINTVVTMFGEMLARDRTWSFVGPYIDDDSSVCHYGDELYFALWHLKCAEIEGSNSKLRAWPVQHRSLDNVIGRLERLMRSVQSPVETSKDEHARRQKRRKSKRSTQTIIRVVRAAQQRLKACKEQERIDRQEQDNDPSRKDEMAL